MLCELFFNLVLVIFSFKPCYAVLRYINQFKLVVVQKITSCLKKLFVVCIVVFCFCLRNIFLSFEGLPDTRALKSSAAAFTEIAEGCAEVRRDTVFVLRPKIETKNGIFCCGVNMVKPV